MNVETAKQELSTAKNIDEWNFIRSSIKGFMTVTDLAIIDGCGFIKVVKQNNDWKSVSH